jgi:eukaryotic-like serine/threonine-protein kinase
MAAPAGGTPPTGPGRPSTNEGEGYSPEDPELPPGAILGKYSIVRRLGGGGMGAVYEAMHIEIQKPVALKVLSNRLSLDPRAQTRFLREAAAASRLDHPHVVNVTDYGSENGLPFLVMELLRGEDLAGHIERNRGALPVETTANIMLAVCAGVYAAHEAGIVHRDLKPQNIFLARTPLAGMEAKVLDFGISKVDDDRARAALTNTGMVLGTTHYLSPEQVMGREVDARSDQYALGVVLYECLTGRRPHEAETIYLIMRSIGEGTFEPPTAWRPDLPRELDAVVMRAMHRDPSKRFESVHALGRALLPFSSIRERIVWAEYYERERLESPTGIGKLLSPPGGQPYLPRTAPIAPSPGQAHPTPGGPPLPATRTTHRDAQRDGGQGVSSVAPWLPLNVGGTGTMKVKRRSWGLWAAVAVASGLALVGYLWNKFPSNEEPMIEPLPAPVAPAPTPAPPATVTGPGVAGAPGTQDPPPPPVPAIVTVTIADAPPGLIIKIDGNLQKLPLKLERGKQYPATFWAPGYESKATFITADEDQRIQLNLEKLAGPKPPKGKGSKAGGKGSKSPGQGDTKEPKTPPVPPPIIDI